MRQSSDLTQWEMDFHFDVVVVQDRNVTVAKLDNAPFPFTVGSAKRAPGDKHDPAIGMLLALSRLFRKMADDIQADVDEAVLINVGQKQAPRDSADRFSEAFRK